MSNDAGGAQAMVEAGGDVEAAVGARYSAGAARVEPALCCPIQGYDPQYLRLVPREIIEKDYGCGDPSAHVEAGETVIDLGSGAGKLCYILAQKVGPAGRVIGLDMNDDMLALARRHQGEFARKLGYGNLEFRKARIQDLALDLDAAERRLRERPIHTVAEFSEFDAFCSKQRRERPLVADDSVDVIVSSCVLNLVRGQDKPQLFAEMFRVLRRGGRAVVSDIVCDRDVTLRVKGDPDLWSGCIAGAFREDAFPALFAEAGFHGIEILSRADQRWRVIDGIEFRSMTVRAFKGKHGPCLEGNQAVIYRGPWKQVLDDDGHALRRGRRTAVCDKTFHLLTDPRGPYSRDIIAAETLPASGDCCSGGGPCC